MDKKVNKMKCGKSFENLNQTNSLTKKKDITISLDNQNSSSKFDDNLNSNCSLKEKMSTNLNNSTTSSKNQDVSILNKNDECEIIQFSSDDMLETIQVEDSTVEIIGYVDEIDGPKIVGKGQQYRLLKFMINNNSRHRVQVVARNNEIDRVQFHLKPNRIIHVDGAKAKKPKITEFNSGTLPYELLIRSNTIINNVGVFNLKSHINNNINPKLIKLEDIPDNLNNCILVQGYIKTNFNTFSNNFKTSGYGSITDGVYKLEIQVLDYEQTNDFEKGQRIEVKGYVKLSNDNIFYLEVEKNSNIKLTEIYDTISFNKCLQGSKPIKKRAQLDDNSNLPNKNIRKNQD